MKHFNYSKGRQGESIARRFLLNKGFTHLQSNFSCPLGEIDLIMTHLDILIFVEVKLKITDTFGTPEDMITPNKITRLKRIATAFLQMYPNISKIYQKYRFDAVCIVLNSDRTLDRITHYPNLSS